MEKFRLYTGLVRNGKWFNYAESQPIQGGTLAMLDSGDKTGAGRLLTLIKGAIKNLYTEDGEKYELGVADYPTISAVDSWKIGYEQIKIITGEPFPVIPENFFCNRCSRASSEKYTEVYDSWQKLIDDGLIDEFFPTKPDCTFKVELPDPIEIQGGRTIVGGTFSTIVMRPITLGDMLSIHKNSEALSTEANMIYATWDASIISVLGMTERDFNIIKRVPGTFFTKTYIVTQKNRDAIEKAMTDNMLGIDATDRKIACKFCGEEIGGYLDFTNFFSPLLPKRSIRSRT